MLTYFPAIISSTGLAIAKGPATPARPVSSAGVDGLEVYDEVQSPAVSEPATRLDLPPLDNTTREEVDETVSGCKTPDRRPVNSMPPTRLADRIEISRDAQAADLVHVSDPETDSGPAEARFGRPAQTEIPAAEEADPAASDPGNKNVGPGFSPDAYPEALSLRAEVRPNIPDDGMRSLISPEDSLPPLYVDEDSVSEVVASDQGISEKRPGRSPHPITVDQTADGVASELNRTYPALRRVSPAPVSEAQDEAYPMNQLLEPEPPEAARQEQAPASQPASRAKAQVHLPESSPDLSQLRAWLATGAESETVPSKPAFSSPASSGEGPSVSSDSHVLEDRAAAQAREPEIRDFVLSIGSIHVTVEEPAPVPAVPAPARPAEQIPKPAAGESSFLNWHRYHVRL